MTAGSSIDGKKKSVCWGTLTFYVFPNILGDNPSVSEGAPLTIGWKHENKSQLAIDYYEYLRDNRPRRKRKELILPSTIRDTFLLGMGYSLQQLVDATDEVRKIRKSRQANMKGTWEKFKRVFELKSKKAANSSNKQKEHRVPLIMAAKCG